MKLGDTDENIGSLVGMSGRRFTLDELEGNDSDVLYHITVIMPTRDEYPGAQGEERIYTEWGAVAAARKAQELIEKYVIIHPIITKQSPEARSPVCC